MNHTEQLPLYGKITPIPAIRRYQTVGLLIGLIGLAATGMGAFLNNEQFWRSYLLAYVFWLEIAVGCLGMLMLHHLVGGRWSAVIRRLMETGAMTLPLLALLFIPLLFGLHTLYPWTDPQFLAKNAVVQSKTAYLNIPFFIGRAVIYFAIWLSLAYLFNRWSLAQDQTGDPKLVQRMRRLSALGMILYMLTSTFAAYDWLMSLEPAWASSIYGLLFIIGQALAALSLALIGLHVLTQQHGGGKELIKSFNDLGNFMLGFVMIWAYFAFSQFLIIWSANIPEEAVWYVHRTHGGWQSVGLFLIAFHFVLPFFLLLSRRIKRQAQLLMALAVLILCVRFVDLFWLIVPAFYPEGLHMHWLDFVIVLALGGLWFAFFLWQWTGKTAVPQHDPHL